MTSIVQVGNVQSERPNGVHAAIRRLSARLIADGHDVEVWHFSRSARRVSMRSEAGIPVVDLPVAGPRGRVGSYLQLASPRTLRWLRDRSTGVDVVHLHSVFQPDHVWASRLGIPYVVTPHGGYPEGSFSGPQGVLKRLGVHLSERALLTGADRVQVLSAQEERQVRSFAPRSAPFLLRFPTDPPDDVPVDYRPDGPVVFVGRLDRRQKGLDILLDAVAAAAGGLGNRRVLLIGSDVDGSGRELSRQAARLGIAERISVLPPVRQRADLTRLLRESSLFVHPSRWEGLPTAVLDAMGAAIPVLVSPETNLGDLVLEHGCGVVAPATPASFAAALSAILRTDPSERADMGIRGRETVRKLFSWESLRAGYRELYSRVEGM